MCENGEGAVRERTKLKNLLSRKFIVTAAVIAGGIATGLKAAGDPIVQSIGIIVACIAGIVLVTVEGDIDATSIAASVEGAIEELESISTDKEED